MAEKKIGFIGCGNLATAILTGLLDAAPDYIASVWVSNHSPEKLNAFSSKYPVHTTLDNCEVARDCDILFLTVKPNKYEDVLAQIQPVLSPKTILISVAAGLSISFIEEATFPQAKVIRCMPNTPSMLGCGMNAICPNKNVTAGECDAVKALFDHFGVCEIVTENLFDTVTGVSGSGPAYVYLFIDAMAKAAVSDGMPKDQAITFAAQTALGAAKMVLESGTDPETLTQNVCSPGGTTIEAVNVFREDGLYELVQKAQHACVEKSKKMSK